MLLTVGERPAGGGDHRGRGGQGSFEARRHGRRGHLGEHGHRRRHGLRPAWLRLRHLHGRTLQRRAPPTHAHARRQGHRHAQGRQGHRHGPQGRGALRHPRLVPLPPGKSEPLVSFIPNPSSFPTQRPVQFETEANWKFHELTTGPEIVNDFKGKKLTHWVTGYGTGGTFHGAGKALKAALPDLEIVLAEPSAAGLLASGVPTERNADGSPAESHPAFNPHPIQGWTPDFVPLVLEQAPMDHLMDTLFPIPGDKAVETAKLLAQNEGLLTGISGGGTMYAALETAKTAPEGSVILAMLPDTGERYLSTPLFADIAGDMNEEELDIAKSTPSFQLLPDQEPILQAA
mmetsp:Transcript_21083/g.67943  ORF Transcript_21083/g.67943 Transcript_21083/m.67943 type:complete len:345 (+) Transcript_21083:332-1366(+)